MKKFPRQRGPYSGKPVRQENSRHPRFERELSVLYEDDAIIALNKPAKLLAVPAENSSAPSALSLLTEALKAKRQRAFVVHRIDRYTSGILLFAKTWPDREALVRQFLEHTPVRQYLAVVRGHLTDKNKNKNKEGKNRGKNRGKNNDGVLVHHFRQEGMFQKLTHARDPKAARAELRYSVERLLRGATLVRVSLATGLQNQIRVQLSALGHPVIGDRKYHPAEAAERRITRVALHAAHLEFAHPRTGEIVSLDCEPPADFQSLLHALKLPSRSRP